MKTTRRKRQSRAEVHRLPHAIHVTLLLAALGFCAAWGQDASRSADGHVLLRTGSFASDQLAALPETYRLVSYNLHGPPTRRINDMIWTLKNEPSIKDAAVLLLQEVNRGHRGSGSLDLDEVLARELEMHHAWAFENYHGSGGGERGLAILSRFPLTDVERVLLPVVGPGGRRRIALGATVDLGVRRIRVYTLHLETRISTEERGRQIEGLLENADLYDDELPVVVMGDFNTIMGGARRKMFSLMEAAGYRCPLPGTKKTFQQKFFFRLKLDWIWVKGLEPLSADVETKITISDHRPVWVDFRR